MKAKKVFAVFGNPIRHSLSPVIHTMFGHESGVPIKYTAELVGRDKFKASATRFFSSGGTGINVTLPFKGEAFRLANKRTERAERAGAANTLFLADESKIGCDNTDGIGLVRDIKENLGWEIKYKRLLIIGAGGATRGILGPLLNENPKHIQIVNRTLSRAKTLAEDFCDLGSVFAGEVSDVAGERFDLILNATSAGINEEELTLPANLINEAVRCYDLSYGATSTQFIRWAMDRSALACSDGLGMLVEQAAESFFIWHGIRPATQNVFARLRKNEN